MLRIDDAPPFIPQRAERFPRTGTRGGARAGADRPFVGWDGEGWTNHVCGREAEGCSGCPHHYFLFGSSTGHSVEDYSLSTEECLRTMLECERDNQSAIHVGFAFKYDSEMMLRDVPRGKMLHLRHHNFCTWEGYRIEYIPGKWFQVSGYIPGDEKRYTCRIQDVFSFFGCSFVKALKQWGVGSDAELKSIEEGKSLRSGFSREDTDRLIRPYWRMELRLLVELANALRSVLLSGGYDISSWFGPGAIASFTYKKQRQAEFMDRELDERIIDASCRAYAGGRFEQFRAGLYEGPVYSADINSAYPYAMSLLPNLAAGEWEYGNVPVAGKESQPRPEVARLGLYHVRYVVNQRARREAIKNGFPLPTFHRNPSGSVVYPSRVDNWVHAPEYDTILDLESLGFFETLDVLEWWVFHDDGSFPFAWVSDLYRQRKQWKTEGNPAQLAAKLGLNSLYGKLAQRVGGRDGHIPTFHQLEYAGAITSKCRAMLLQQSLRNYKGLIAFETDGIYSTLPFDHIDGGDGLGQWEQEEYSGILYVQSGVYWLRDMDGNWKAPKSRGVPQKSLDIQVGLEAMREQKSIEVTQQSFIGFGAAMMRRGKGWRTWSTQQKTIEFGGSGKRQHVKLLCNACMTGLGWDQGLHNLTPVPRKGNAPSLPHPLPWRQKATRGVQHQRELNTTDV